MRALRRAALAAACALPLLLPAGTAEAATYRWANTDLVYGSQPLTVRWCAGGTGRIPAKGHTRKDVCGFYLRYNLDVYAWVRETGTLLHDNAYCGTGNGRWVTFTSRTDTSRTANVTATTATCA